MTDSQIYRVGVGRIQSGGRGLLTTQACQTKNSRDYKASLGQNTLQRHTWRHVLTHGLSVSNASGLYREERNAHYADARLQRIYRFSKP